MLDSIYIVLHRYSNVLRCSSPGGDQTDIAEHDQSAQGDVEPLPQRKLPQEVCEQVLDQLPRDDIETLRRCSLVCKDWLPRASTYLFRRLRWPLCHANQCDTTLAGREYFEALLTLLSTTPRVRSHVKELLIGRHTCADGAEGREKRQLPFSLLFQILDLLSHPQLIHLIYCGLDFDLSPETPYRKDRLRLEEMRISDPNVSQICRLLPNFRHISKLHVTSFALRPVTALDIPTGSRVEVNELTLSGHMLEDSLEGIRNLIDTSSLRRIALIGQSLSMPVAVMLNAASKLDALEYHVNPAVIPSDLSLQLQLDSLTIWGTVDINPGLPAPFQLAGDAMWDSIFRDIDQIAMPDTKRMRVVFQCALSAPDVDYMACLETYLLRLSWTSIATIFERYPNLQGFAVDVLDALVNTDADQRRGVLERVISQKLPSTVAEKIEVMTPEAMILS